jgi:hypothetical protein
MKGLEPPRLSAPDPKSGAAANYATSAVHLLFFSLIARQKTICPMAAKTLKKAQILVTFRKMECKFRDY